MQLVITPVDDVRCLHDESLDLTSLGSVHVQRGSHVEPDLAGQWFADMSPVDGPRLGPFPRRSNALSAEVAWLRDHWLVPPMVSDSAALVWPTVATTNSRSTTSQGGFLGKPDPSRCADDPFAYWIFKSGK